MAATTNPYTSGIAGTIPATAYASLPPAANGTGQLVYSTNIGGGNLLMSTGTRYKAVGGNALLDSIDTPNTGTLTTTEEQLNLTHRQIPANTFQGFDRFRVFLSFRKSGAVDTATFRLRFGTAGTVADPIIYTLVLGTTNRTWAGFVEFKCTSATAVQLQGNGEGTFTGFSTSDTAAAVTVSNLTANGMYLSITSQMTAGTETATVQDYTLEWFPTDS